MYAALLYINIYIYIHICVYIQYQSRIFKSPLVIHARFFQGEKGKDSRFSLVNWKPSPPPSLCIVPSSPIISSRRIYLDSLPDLVCAGRKTRSRSNLGEKVGPSVKEPPVKEEREKKKLAILYHGLASKIISKRNGIRSVCCGISNWNNIYIYTVKKKFKEQFFYLFRRYNWK